MNAQNSFVTTVEKICSEDDRYAVDAYLFVREALDVTSKMLDKPHEGPARHVSGQELLEGIRMYALQEFGPMTRTVLSSWGVCVTEDFGEIVFRLVESDVLGKTEEDTRADFKDGYGFEDAFVAPFLPESVSLTRVAERKKGTAARGKTHGNSTNQGEIS